MAEERVGSTPMRVLTLAALQALVERRHRNTRKIEAKSGNVAAPNATLIARGTLCPGHKRVPRAHGIINFGRGL